MSRLTPRQSHADWFFSKHGLLSWRFTSLVLPGGATSPYSHQLELVFKDDQGIATAFRDEGE